MIKNVLFICLIAFIGFTVEGEETSPLQHTSYEEFILAEHAGIRHDLLANFMYSPREDLELHTLAIINRYSGHTYGSLREVPLPTKEFFKSVTTGSAKGMASAGNPEITRRSELPELRTEGLDHYADFVSEYENRLLEFDLLYAYAQSLRSKERPERVASKNEYDLCREEELYLFSHFMHAAAIRDATNGVNGYSDEMFGPLQTGTDSTKANAVKHALWNYLIAKNISDNILWTPARGRTIAKEFTDIHEECGNGEYLNTSMDYHNNAVGRLAHQRNPSMSREEIKREFWQLFRKASCTTNFYVASPETLIHFKTFTGTGPNHSVDCAYPCDSGRVPLYRYFNYHTGDHSYTTEYGEFEMGEYPLSLQGTQAYIYPCQAQNSVPFYQYYNHQNGDHHYTADFSELGVGNSVWEYQGIQGYVTWVQVPGSVPLYEYFNYSNGVHLFTTNFNELGYADGSSAYYHWSYQGVACYVFNN